MKKIILIGLAIGLLLPVLLMAKVEYLSEEEYKKLSKKERLHYWETLENELAANQERKANALANQEKYSTRIEELNQELADLNNDYDVLHQEILDYLGVSVDDFAGIQSKIDYFNEKIDNWNQLSDKDLWKAKKSVQELIAEYNEYRQTNYAKVPDFQEQFSDLDNKISNLEMNLQAAKPKYYEDSYTVVRGDYLSKIAGYTFIYNDWKKWPIIYRANRDQIKDPNLIYPNQILKIPRGLPNTWKVYRGECLWRIASYPEVYNNAAKWPAIYRANKDQIKDPDLIYPDQIFDIPRD
ncbi:MAG: LysM peptidoglycan-binding domain-containing protein [Candidatus Cloacimonetes bacterium]|nr:LysM peptidoglycan-binding domain-containing protein [Candidatus Cloacimonadota bacterium]